MKLFSLFLLFFGESLAIYTEIAGAKSTQSLSVIDWQTFIKLFVIMTLAGGSLLLGYMLGMISFKSAWVVAIISILSILIIEPILIFSFFREMPSKGSIVGLAFGLCGIAATLMIKE